MVGAERRLATELVVIIASATQEMDWVAGRRGATSGVTGTWAVVTGPASGAARGQWFRSCRKATRRLVHLRRLRPCRSAPVTSMQECSCTLGARPHGADHPHWVTGGPGRRRGP